MAAAEGQSEKVLVCARCKKLVDHYYKDLSPFACVNWFFTTKEPFIDKGQDKVTFGDGQKSVAHAFPYDEAWSTDALRRNFSLCERIKHMSSKDDWIILATKPDEDGWTVVKHPSKAHTTVEARWRPRSVMRFFKETITLEDMLSVMDRKLSRLWSRWWIGGSAMLHALDPSLGVTPNDVDVFFWSSCAQFRHLMHVMLGTFGGVLVDGITGKHLSDGPCLNMFSRSPTHVRLEFGALDCFPVRSIDLIQIQTGSTFAQYNDLSITRPILTCNKSRDQTMKIYSGGDIECREVFDGWSVVGEACDFKDIKERTIGVRLKVDSACYKRTDKRIQKYLERGFASVRHDELVAQPFIPYPN